MVKMYCRTSILVRWFHRCPECGIWGALKVHHKERSISGVYTDYVCRKCNLTMQDWKPSGAVKF